MRLNLFCFPYAGASAMVYARWRRRFPEWLEVRPVELPGRGKRLAEPPCEDAVALAAQLAAELAPETGGSYALFGHSLGALLAFETAHALAQLGAPVPRALFVSGADAPSRRDRGRYEALQSDAELIGEMRRLGGTPVEVLESPELLALTLPALRADFRMCAGYRHRPRRPLPCRLHAFGGSADETGADSLSAWRDETAGAYSLDLLDGGHFFIHSQEQRLTALLRHYAEDCATRLPAAPTAA